MIIDAERRLTGIFTDSDLARLFEHRQDAALDAPIHSVMTANPLTALQGSLMSEAVALMARRKISELPVVDADGRPIGLIDITDVVGLFPTQPAEETSGEDAIRTRASENGWGIVADDAG
jgi:arabinose-5-phosphate isomerase